MFIDIVYESKYRTGRVLILQIIDQKMSVPTDWRRTLVVRHHIHSIV